MSGFNDLLVQAQPSLLDGCIASATAGRSWRWEITGFVDSQGANIDLSTGTASCVIQDRVDGPTVYELGVIPGNGMVTIVAPPSATAGLAAGQQRRHCVWSLVLTLGGAQVQVWGPLRSQLVIEAD